MIEKKSFTKNLIVQINVDQATLLEFFAVFSRLEYSLKRAGYITLKTKGEGENKKVVGVEANWDEFAKELEQYFNKEDKLVESAVDYLTKNPPAKQISSTGWQEQQPWNEREPILKWLLVAIRRVRNNLFHGGKFPTKPVKDPVRDQHLLKHSLSILEECLCLDAEPAKKVKYYFIGSLE